MDCTARLTVIRDRFALAALLSWLLLTGCGREPDATKTAASIPVAEPVATNVLAPTGPANPIPSRVAPPAAKSNETAMIFTTEGAAFAPVLTVDGTPSILWTWSDGTTSTSPTPRKAFGTAGTRSHSLHMNPWSAIRRINLGYDAGDGGSGLIEHVPDQQVSAVKGLELVAPTLRHWCSSYNRLTALDFSNFVNLDTIECFQSRTLNSVKLVNTPKLKRACFEACGLRSLDLSQSPALEDLRGATNAYPTIDFGQVGRQVWHICIRDNPQLTNQSLFADMGRFPNISELFIWNDNQAGTLRLPASSPNRYVAILADGNHYTAADLTGSLRNADSSATVSFRNNQLASLRIEGCVQITQMTLEHNRLDAGQVDALLLTLDKLGRSRSNTDSETPLRVDLRGNAAPGPAGRAAAVKLAAKGWTIDIEGQTLQPPPPPETGEARIDFVTRGPATRLRCDFAGKATATWHWSDGTSLPATSGAEAVKEGLGPGDHPGYLTISNGSALTRFGAVDGGGQGHFVAISGLNQAPLLSVLYAYSEGSLTTLSRTSATKLREYHLLGTGLSPIAQDQVFADAVATGVRRGHIWCGGGTPTSNSARDTLVKREWIIDH